ACAAGLGQRLGRAQKSLRGHASPVRALAAHQLALDDGKREAAALQPARDRLARDSTSQAHGVKLLRQLAILLRSWSRGRRVATTRAARSLKTTRGTDRRRT